jgi:hypothetical protein
MLQTVAILLVIFIAVVGVVVAVMDSIYQKPDAGQ